MSTWAEGHEGERLTTIRSSALLEIQIHHGSVNALDATAYREILEVFTEVDSTPSVGVVLLIGRNDCFSAGQDVTDAPEIRADPASYLRAAAASLVAATQSTAIVVAGVQRFAIGAGLILATSADLLVLDESARVWLPELDYGVTAGAAHVSRWLGEPAAQRALLTGAPIQPREFAHAGAEVVPGQELAGVARSLAVSLAQRGAPTARMAKAAAIDARRVLAERYRNEIQTTIAAGITDFSPSAKSDPPRPS